MHLCSALVHNMGNDDGVHFHTHALGIWHLISFTYLAEARACASGQCAGAPDGNGLIKKLELRVRCAALRFECRAISCAVYIQRERRSEIGGHSRARLAGCVVIPVMLFVHNFTFFAA